MKIEPSPDVETSHYTLHVSKEELIRIAMLSFTGEGGHRYPNRNRIWDQIDVGLFGGTVLSGDSPLGALVRVIVDTDATYEEWTTLIGKPVPDVAAFREQKASEQEQQQTPQQAVTRYRRKTPIPKR